MRSRWDDESGATTLWMLGIALLVLTLGVLSVDLWQAVAVRSELAGRVDAAVAAGASGVDDAHLRATGELRLDPDLARYRAREAFGLETFQTGDALPYAYRPTVTPTAIVVEASRTVTPMLLFLLGEVEPLTVTVTRRAEARLD